MTPSFRIRPAAPGDASAVSLLMLEAIGDIAYTISGTEDLPDTLSALEELFRLPNCRLSFRSVLVCEAEGGGIAGFALSYPGAEAAALDEPLLRRLRSRGLPTSGLVPEARPGEYYLDSLSVDEAYRGSGLGTRLIEAFERRAAELGEARAMLLVDRANVKARALYERLGYREDGSVELSGHAYDRMAKPVG
ncbi:GNAT family N-acetyltransferase [Saccharibacillus sp. CPCC 101409]|uniref:GNAT family N-acetyltransferase n=1 Tax=Saccharibacillus sp. CPCC 101409 TaxID=3058041 RepID=UPI002672FBD4|nr:GNAT family N-acetyltransferase [Saccharibacillus sp. CPCC 101409]MDO3408462.1 GNAT family N-acetyltransferase [Saccharibacillus sp. CPCC 101409]